MELRSQESKGSSKLIEDKAIDVSISFFRCCQNFSSLGKNRLSVSTTHHNPIQRESLADNIHLC